MVDCPAACRDSSTRPAPATPKPTTCCLRSGADDLYRQHADETGQVFTAETVGRAFDLTGGHPWLVNALARQAVEVVTPDPSTLVTPEIVEAAKEKLIQRRDTHLDSLIDKLREPRVSRVIEPPAYGLSFMKSHRGQNGS